MFVRSSFACFLVGAFGMGVAAAAPISPASPPAAAAEAASRSAAISGVIRDASGRALAGARVSLEGATPSSTTTAADGSFAIGHLQAGTYLVTVARTGYVPFSTTVDAVENGGAPLEIALGEASQSTLRTIGTVVHASSATSLNTSPAATATLTQQQYVDRAQNQVSNLLEELPGVELTRASSGGAPGANTNVALRGADPSETQVLIDGHPITGGPAGTYLIQFLNPKVLGSVEVDKGPGALGNTIADQVNGTVNFRTPSITSKPTGTYDFSYDSYNGSSYAGRFSNTFGKVGVSAAYAFYGTPGYNTQPVLSVVPDGNSTPTKYADATVTTAIGGSQTFNNRAENFKLGYNFSPATSVTFGFLGLQTYVDYTSTLTTEEPFNIIGYCPNPANGKAPAVQGTGTGCGLVSRHSGKPTYTAPGFAGLIGHTVYASSTLDNLYLGNYETDNEPLFTGDFRTTLGNGSLLARYYASSISRFISDPNEAFQQLQCDDPTCSFGVSQANKDVASAFYQQQIDILHGGDLEYELPIGPNTYAVSFDSHSDRTTSGSGSDPAQLAYNVPSILQTSTTISGRGNLRFGRRFGAVLANYFSNTTFVGSRYDPRVGLTYQVNPSAILRLAGGSSYVAPSAQNAFNTIPHFVNKTYYVGPTVKPETSTSFDLGTDILTSKDSKIVFDAYVTRVFDRFSSYQQRFTPAITIAGQPATALTTTYNGGTALEKGLELSFERAPRYGLGVRLDANLLRAYGGGDSFFLPGFSRNGIYGRTSDGSQFPSYPYSHGNVQLEYTTRKDIRPSVGLTYYGALNSFQEPGFALFYAGLDARVAGGAHVIANIQNIFNHDDNRTYGIYGFGVVPTGGGAQSLFFAPPRMFTLQLQQSL